MIHKYKLTILYEAYTVQGMWEELKKKNQEQTVISQLFKWHDLIQPINFLFFLWWA